LKVALVHDWLINFSGAEKVLESLYEIYEAPIYTLIKDEKCIKGTSLEKAKIYTSFLQNFPLIKKYYQSYFPLFPFAIEQLNLDSYEIIISSSHAIAKGILRNSEQIHVCYCHTPMRYAWDLYHKYTANLNPLKKVWAKLVLHYMRMWDISTANRVDYFIANSKYVAKRIKKIYRRPAKVIYPPVDVNKFNLEEKKEDFYVTVSRLVPYKRVDLIVKAFTQKRNKKLFVIGDGPELKNLKKIATDNIEFLGKLTQDELKKYVCKAKAFIYASIEDFGIAVVEAQACGTPVIALGKGGTLETVLDKKTGLLYFNQSVEDLIKVLDEFEKFEKSFDPYIIREHAKNFSKEKFKENMESFLKRLEKLK